MPFGQVKTTIAHEANHVLLGHHIRIAGKDPELSNIAADHVINNILLKDGFEPIPGWLCDPRVSSTSTPAFITTRSSRPAKKWSSTPRAEAARATFSGEGMTPDEIDDFCEDLNTGQLAVEVDRSEEEPNDGK
jgi:hypothetical protein